MKHPRSLKHQSYVASFTDTHAQCDVITHWINFTENIITHANSVFVRLLIVWFTGFLWLFFFLIIYAQKSHVGSSCVSLVWKPWFLWVQLKDSYGLKGIRRQSISGSCLEGSDWAIDIAWIRVLRCNPHVSQGAHVLKVFQSIKVP